MYHTWNDAVQCVTKMDHVLQDDLTIVYNQVLLPNVLKLVELHHTWNKFFGFRQKITMCFAPILNILLRIVSKMLSNLLENGEKYVEKCNFYIKYFDKIKCYADRPYLVFLELKPETHIYFFFGP